MTIDKAWKVIVSITILTSSISGAYEVSISNLGYGLKVYIILCILIATVEILIQPKKN